MRNLTLRSLHVFEAAASALSYSRAGELLGMTQSAVSQQIRQLEDEVGTRLFDTQSRPIRMTDAGHELVRHARVILAQVGVAEDALSTLGGDLRGQLHLGVVPPANNFVPAMLAAFRARHPDARLKLTVGRRDALLAQLAEHRIDMVLGGYPPADAEVEAEAFARHPHVVIARADHPLADRESLVWTDLSDEVFIFREQGSATRAFLEHLLQVQRLQVPAGIELQGNDTVRQAVMAGLGISFVSAHICQVELDAGRIAVLKVDGMPKWLDWCVLSRRDMPLLATQRAFRDFVLAQGADAARCRID